MKYPGTALKTSEFDHVEIVKQIKNHHIFLETITTSMFYIKRQTYLIKVVNW